MLSNISLLTRIPLLPASAEIWDQPQSLSITVTFDCPVTRYEKTGIHESRPTISGDCCPPATDNVHADTPTTNGAVILLIPEDSMSLVIFPEHGEDVKSEPPTTEGSQRPHRFSVLASAPATIGTLLPAALKVMPREGVHCPGHPITIALLTSDATMQSRRRWQMRWTT